jgi:competence protein ComGF
MQYTQECHGKAAFNKKKNLCTRKLYLNLRKKQVKCYIWITNIYGVENWTLQKADQKYLGGTEK